MATGKLYRQIYTDRNGNKRESPFWWYDIHGPRGRIRKSTGKTDREAAERVMYGVLAEETPPEPGNATLSDLRRLIVRDYKRHGRKTAGRVARRFKPLAAHFGATRKASNITTNAVNEYADARLAAGRTRATVNRELAAFRRAFTIAYELGIVQRVPVIRSLTERNTRTGFVRPDDFERLVKALPRDVAALARVAYVTGWRRGELLSRDWRHVDLGGGWLRLDPGETKNDEGRMFPMPDLLLRTLEDQYNRAEDTWGSVPPDAPVFFRSEGTHRGQRIARFDVVWHRATKAVGLEGVLFHDLRRSAVRNLVRSGTPETVCMRLTGHRTNSVFKRYAIVDERDLIEATERLNARLNGGRK